MINLADAGPWLDRELEEREFLAGEVFTMADSTTQSKNCVSPTPAIPTILPIINWKGFTLLTITSAMRFVFSSITPRITDAP